MLSPCIHMGIFDVLPKLAITQLGGATTGWPLVVGSMPIEGALTLPSSMLVCGSNEALLFVGE